MAKNGMFDTAFLIASKYNLDKELHNSLCRGYILNKDLLKKFIEMESTDNNMYLDIMPNLKKLKISFNTLTSINLSHNHKLMDIRIQNTTLTNLEVPSSTINLSCDFNEINNLILDNCKKLEKLSCVRNKLQSLDVSNCEELNTLNIYNNNIKIIDLSKNLKIKYLLCNDKLKKIILNEEQTHIVKFVPNNVVIEYDK